MSPCFPSQDARNICLARTNQAANSLLGQPFPPKPENLYYFLCRQHRVPMSLTPGPACWVDRLRNGEVFGSPTSHNTVSYIVELGTEVQVVRPNTEGNITAVEHVLPIWDWSSHNFPSDPVGSPLDLGDDNVAVASGSMPLLTAGPQPTWPKLWLVHRWGAMSVNLSPEPLNLSRCIHGASIQIELTI